MERGSIELRGVRVNNLRNVSLSIPRGQLVVLTGLSGSGKSSLAFETLYAEGQRRYVQSLSAYARQFLNRLPKPDADYIGGIPPAIVIEQKVSTRNARSTVGTASEVYDYLRLLYARVGRYYAPETGQEVRAWSVKEVVDYVLTFAGKRVMILIPIEGQKRDERLVHLEILALEGYSRVLRNGQVEYIETPEQREVLAAEEGDLELLVDRFVPEATEEFIIRCTEAVETAQRQGVNSYTLLVQAEEPERHTLEVRPTLYGKILPPLMPALFSFNSGLGACPECEGYGQVLGIDEELVVPDKSRSVYNNAVVCWKGPAMGSYRKEFIAAAAESNFPIHRPYYQLSDEHRRMLWNGLPGAKGIRDFFAEIASRREKVQYRVMLARYSGRSECSKCEGRRLRPEAQWVRVGGVSLTDLLDMPLEALAEHFAKLTLDEHDARVASRLLHEIRTRLSYLLDVGLGYLTLNRPARTLSGGEMQRIHLSAALGSSLVGSLYILDEPSVGLHSVDSHRLINVMRRLRDLGNTVLVVEHDEEIIRAADTVVDMGPGAGCYGGEVVYTGDVEGLQAETKSLTGQYLSRRMEIERPQKRRAGCGHLHVDGIFVHTLQNVEVNIPLGCMVVVTGVSGSGKSSLVRQGILPAVRQLVDKERSAVRHYSNVAIHGAELHAVEYVDQDPLARSARSTPVTYINAYDPIRQLMAMQPLAKLQGYSPGFFSFNSPGGRCEACEGTGEMVVPMQFMADVSIKCEECHGTRFRKELLDVQYRGKNIDDVLRMSVVEAVAFFRADPLPLAQRIATILQILEDVGLGYVALGQSTSTLSGGEAQRLKLATYIAAPSSNPMLFAFDEPTTGLHFHDIHCLMDAFTRLLEKGHSLLIVEHNVEVMRMADWIIDMGPGPGLHGGRIVVAGTPEMVAAHPESITARFLRERL